MPIPGSSSVHMDIYRPCQSPPRLGKVHRYGLLILDQSSHSNVPCIVVPEAGANCKDYYSRMRQKSPQVLLEHVQF